MVDHFGRQLAGIEAIAFGFFDVQRAGAFPGNAHTFVEAFDPEGLARQQEALTIARDHFIQGDGRGFAVDLDQVALETLAALMEGDDQRVVAFLQLAQVAGDFQGRGQHLWWLRSIIRA